MCSIWIILNNMTLHTNTHFTLFKGLKLFDYCCKVETVCVLIEKITNA